ncbi:substrate-binding domain-containing protein, partial [Halobacillus sp. BBL2006]|uniref:substrate-binding domain-containing protein n=1 Tax=Halobacillus sp. BBL2006 TaxID=1543706 RepID=UPI0005438832
SEWGYQVIVCQTHDSKKKEIDYLQLLKTKQVDGVIMASIINKWEDVEPYLESGPIVVCNEYMEKTLVPMVHMDHKKASYEATLHLIDQGCKNIAYVSGGPDSYLTLERRKGFEKAIQERENSLIEGISIDWALDVKDGQKVFHSIKEDHPYIDGVFTGSDEVAAGIIYEASQSDWEIPRDLAVVGFDNQMISLLMVPSVTTVEQPVKQMAYKSVEILLQQLLHPGTKYPREYVYEHELLIRNSTKRRKLSVQ